MRQVVASMLLLLGLLPNFGCTSNQSTSSGGKEISVHCPEIQNPYDDGTGHYAGFEWAQDNGATTCGGSSDPFIEGCEEYQRQEAEYANCEAKQNR
jgi:hypothetical protein